MLGGYGGGDLMPATDCKTAVPWSLPQGDKTWFIMVNKEGEDDDEGQKKGGVEVTTLFCQKHSNKQVLKIKTPLRY